MVESRSPGALEGMRVLDFTWVLAGPLLTRHLAYQGAEVIRVLAKARGDARVIPAMAQGVGVETGSDKLSIGLNLATSEGREFAQRLVEISDIIVENYSVGVMERLSLGWDVVNSLNPSAIMVRFPPMGSTGPLRDQITFGPNLTALTGLDALAGYPGGIPAGMGTSYADFVSAAHGMVGLLACLLRRQITGRGQLLEVAQLESLVGVMGPEVMDVFSNGHVTPPQGNNLGYAAPHGCYPCLGDDSWCAIAVSDEKDWQALRLAMGDPDWSGYPEFATLANRLEYHQDLDINIARWTRQFTPYQVMNRLQESGIAAGAVQSISDLIEKDEHLAFRGYVERTPIGAADTSVSLRRLEPRLSETPGYARRGPARFGEHNHYVFQELLGMGQGQVQAYMNRGVIEELEPDLSL